jgi:hypothetical protein
LSGHRHWPAGAELAYAVGEFTRAVVELARTGVELVEA